MHPRKLTPIFLLLAAFFMAAIWVGLTYNQAKQSRIPKGSAHIVELSDGKAVPNTLIIKTGEVVQFESKDGRQYKIGQGDADPSLHDAARSKLHDDGLKDIQSEVFTDSFRATFPKAGIYFFHDHLDPNIVIEVQAFDPE
jgi:hypothetical protein